SRGECGKLGKADAFLREHVPGEPLPPTRKESTMKNQKGEPRKGDKKRYIRAAIKRLGLDASYGPALKWIKDKYGVEVGEPTYYGVRREMQQDAAAKQGQPRGGAAAAPAAGGEPTLAGASLQAETPPGPTPQPPDRAT